MLRQYLETANADLRFLASGTDKHFLHSYIDNIYEPILELMGPPKAILEIGIFRGGSLALWKTAFKECKVLGIDIDVSNINHPKALQLIKEKKIEILQADAYSETFILNQTWKFDLIIDDGPHTIESQITSLKFSEHLAPLGTLIIEDIDFRHNNFNMLVEALSRLEGFQVQLVNLVLKKGRFDDVVAVVTQNPKVSQFLKNENNKVFNKMLYHPYGRILIRILRCIPLLLFKSKRILNRLFR